MIDLVFHVLNRSKCDNLESHFCEKYPCECHVKRIEHLILPLSHPVVIQCKAKGVKKNKESHERIEEVSAD